MRQTGLNHIRNFGVIGENAGTFRSLSPGAFVDSRLVQNRPNVAPIGTGRPIPMPSGHVLLQQQFSPVLLSQQEITELINAMTRFEIDRDDVVIRTHSSASSDNLENESTTSEAESEADSLTLVNSDVASIDEIDRFIASLNEALPVSEEVSDIGECNQKHN